MQCQAMLFVLGSAGALALPAFPGARDDDLPIPQYWLADVSAKNLNVGMPDIGAVDVGADALLIRIYVGFGQQAFRLGGYPLDMYELRVEQETPTLRWFPRCPGGPEPTKRRPERAWQVLQQHDFFTVRDYRTVADYPSVLDGTSYLVQIKSASAYREFLVANPTYFESDDNTRLLAAMTAIGQEFDTPACYKLQ